MSTCPICLGAGQSVNPDGTATPCSLCETTGELPVEAAQLAWFDYRKAYSATSQEHWAFVAGYRAALRDLGRLPADDYPDA